MSEWLPIDTAPKDGSIVDLWCVGEREEIGFYTGRPAKAGRVTECWFDKDRWRPVTGLATAHGLTIRPTHWMPLPEPPAERAQENANA